MFPTMLIFFKWTWLQNDKYANTTSLIQYHLCRVAFIEYIVILYSNGPR